ncbi:hypothetical protein RCL1_007837 [Eukaryota sp. TZLM3-RCL]
MFSLPVDIYSEAINCSQLQIVQQHATPEWCFEVAEERSAEGLCGWLTCSVTDFLVTSFFPNEFGKKILVPPDLRGLFCCYNCMTSFQSFSTSLKSKSSPTFATTSSTEPEMTIPHHEHSPSPSPTCDLDSIDDTNCNDNTEEESDFTSALYDHEYEPTDLYETLSSESQVEILIQKMKRPSSQFLKEEIEMELSTDELLRKQSLSKVVLFNCQKFPHYSTEIIKKNVISSLDLFDFSITIPESIRPESLQLFAYFLLVYSLEKHNHEVVTELIEPDVYYRLKQVFER